MGSHSTLQTDDGIPLTPKEGIIIDEEGRPLTASPESENPRSGFRVISSGQLPWPVTAVAIVGIAILIPVLVLVAMFFLGLFLLRGLLRAIL